MSGNLSSPWIVNSRLEHSNNKYAEILSTTSENLKKTMLELDYDTLRQVNTFFENTQVVSTNTWFIEIQVDGAGYAPGMSWTSFDDETNLDFYYLLNTGDKIIPEHPYRKNSTAFQMNVPYLIGTTDDEGRGRIKFD